MSDTPSDRPDAGGAPAPSALTDEEATRLARRALLRAGLFAPAVLATLTLASDARAQTATCSCQPPPSCQPLECTPRIDGTC